MMNKELCFNIENENLYLEQVLVDYMDIPIFFLCRGENQYYVALCTDINELSYIVVKLTLVDVYDLLYGKIPMRDIILKQSEYWDVVSGDEVCLDVVKKKNIAEVEKDLLPDENACFKILTKEMQLFVRKFECEFFSDKYFEESNREAEVCEILENGPKDILLENIIQYMGLIDFKMEKTVFSEVPLYDEKMKSIKIAEVTFSNTKQSKRTEIDHLFKLVGPIVNNRVVAA